MGRLDQLQTWVNGRLEVLGHDPVERPSRPSTAVVGIGGSQRGEDAARWAAGIAEAVHLVTVIPSSSAFRSKPGTRRARASEAEMIRDQARGSVRRLERALPHADLSVHVIEGSEGTTLRRAVSEHGAGLLAVGAHREQRHGIPFGSVSSSLLNGAPVSTLAAKAAPGDDPITGAIGTDQASRPAAAWALALAAWLDRPLQLVHAGHADGFEDDGPRAVARTIDWPPRLGIERALEGEENGLIVVGQTTGGAGLGSTALQLARTAPASVLVARSSGTET